MTFVSVFGDSISTFEVFNPKGYEVFYTKYMQERNGLTTVYDTWWAKVNQALRAYICVNNSYSGCRVSGERFPSANCSERTSCLHNGNIYPDYILVYLGFNDFGYGVPIYGKDEFNNTVNVFSYSYDVMLNKLKNNYPNSTIICGTLLKSQIKDNPKWEFPDKYCGVSFELYNEEIRKSVKRCGCRLADLALTNLRYETLDGSHPTVEGHKTLAAAWINSLNL